MVKPDKRRLRVYRQKKKDGTLGDWIAKYPYPVREIFMGMRHYISSGGSTKEQATKRLLKQLSEMSTL